VDWLKSRALPGGLRFLASQDPARPKEFPQVSEEACRAAMQLVLPDGRVYAGELALPHILRALPRWRMAAWIFVIPGVNVVARFVYRLIARNRYRLTCPGRVCTLK
jgi:predicted DCC family thiol-disulfide oxidoreductase YuxK